MSFSFFVVVALHAYHCCYYLLERDTLCVLACVCVCVFEGEREGERESLLLWQVPEGDREQGKMEKSGCKIICGAPTALTIKGLMVMMMTADH